MFYYLVLKINLMSILGAMECKKEIISSQKTFVG